MYSNSSHQALCRMPAEWEAHAGTWIAWPHYAGDWPGKFEPIQWIYAEIVRNIARGESVHIAIQNAAGERRARHVLKLAAVPTRNVRFHSWPSDRVWTRDSFPTFVNAQSGRKLQLAACGWRFNGWAKYSNHKRDARMSGRMAAELAIPLLRPLAMAGSRERHLVLEGGAIDCNGRGSLLTTEECLLSKVQQRNPGVGRTEYEECFRKYLGICNVIWLGKGVAGDDTHGHVDDIARFVAPRTVVAASERDPQDINYKPLKDNLQRLRRARDQAGRRLEVLELPMPGPIVFQGRRLPASYANFYICNSAVLVPMFSDANDRIALNLLARLFPSRKVVGIYSGDLIWGFGAMHCMTQQQPRVQSQ